MKGIGKILIMDDEEIVREIAGELLSFLGYEVTLCEDGNTAVSLYSQAQEAGEGYSAVIMDLTIPGGMGGRETMQKLLEVYPDAKGIVSSGYNNDPILSNCCDYGFSGVVTKPYTMKELSETIQTVLNPACT